MMPEINQFLQQQIDESVTLDQSRTQLMELASLCSSRLQSPVAGVPIATPSAENDNSPMV